MARGATQHFLCASDCINIASENKAIAALGGKMAPEVVPLIADTVSVAG